jgi:hypothetical protein
MGTVRRLRLGPVAIRRQPAISGPAKSLALLLGLAAGCGGRTEPLGIDTPPPPIHDASAEALPETTPEAEAPQPEAREVDEHLSPPPPDVDAACEGEDAPSVSLEQYAGWLCQAEYACAGATAGFGVSPPDFSGCAKIIELRAGSEQVNQLCVNACAQYLQSIQQGGPGCAPLLSGGPRECATTFQSPGGFIYCSRSQGRLTPSEAAASNASDGVWCPSDEQCVEIASPTCGTQYGNFGCGPWTCLE